MKLGIRDINKTAEEDGTSVSLNMLSNALKKEKIMG
jgi:hypothetical protein